MRLGRLMILVPLMLLSVVCEGKPKLDATPPGAGAPEIKLVPVIRGTDHPVYLKSDGTDRLFVVEQPGRIRLVKDGTLAPKPYLDIRDQVFYQGECGLLSVTFHPDFAHNGYLYVDYTSKKNGKLQTFISEFKVDPKAEIVDRKTEREVLVIDQPYANHNGGLVEFGPDGMLYVCMGDGGSHDDPQNRAQNLKELLGKQLRIDVTPRQGYAIPKDNPFVSQAGARGEIWAYGLRNHWRYSWDRKTGVCYAGDVGQNRWEEVDILVKGGNYGWRPREGLHQNPNLRPPEEIQQDRTAIDPIVEYEHTIGLSITGGYVYRGRKSPALDGIYIYADYSTGRFWGLRYEDGKMTENYEFNAMTADGKSTINRILVSSFGEDKDGEVYVCDHNRGVIYRIEAIAAPQQAARGE